MDMRYWNERAAEINYKRTVPGTMLNSCVLQGMDG